MAALWQRLSKRRRDVPEAIARHAGVRRRLDKSRPLEEADFVVFDTELTGLSLQRDSIISIGALRMKGGKILVGRTFSRLVRPEAELNREGVVIHGLRHADLEAAEEPAEVLRDFVELIGDAVLVGHFVHIDVSFVDRALKSTFGVGLKSPAVDTASVHDWLVDNEPGFAKHHGGMSVKKDLFALARRYGIPVDRAHDALYDAYLTAQLFQRFLAFLPRCGVTSLKDLLSVGKP